MSGINSLPGVDTLKPVLQPQQQMDVVHRPMADVPPPARAGVAEKLREEKRRQQERRTRNLTVAEERRNGPARRARPDAEGCDDAPRPRIDLRI